MSKLKVDWFSLAEFWLWHALHVTSSSFWLFVRCTYVMWTFFGEALPSSEKSLLVETDSSRWGLVSKDCITRSADAKGAVECLTVQFCQVASWCFNASQQTQPGGEREHNETKSKSFYLLYPWNTSISYHLYCWNKNILTKGPWLESVCKYDGNMQIFAYILMKIMF